MTLEEEIELIEELHERMKQANVYEWAMENVGSITFDESRQAQNAATVLILLGSMAESITITNLDKLPYSAQMELRAVTLQKLAEPATVTFLSHMAVESGRADIAELLREISGLWATVDGERYYPGPTAMERLQHVFGELVPAREFKKPYIGQNQRHYIYSGVFVGRTTAVQLELPGLAEDNLAEIDRMVIENTDALALKVFHVIFAECYRQHHDWGAWCYYDANMLCDLLGYKRDKNGYHQSRNIYRVEQRLRMLSELKYKFELLGYDPKTEATKVAFEGHLITIDPQSTVSLFKRDTRIAHRSAIRIHDQLYDNMMNRSMFAWYDRDFLQLHPQHHKRAILLYSYYVSQLAMGRKQRKVKHIVRRPLETVLRETGLAIDKKHKGRDMQSLKKAHEELKRRGLILDYSLSGGEVEIMFPENHPALKKYKRTSIHDMEPASLPGVE